MGNKRATPQRPSRHHAHGHARHGTPAQFSAHCLEDALGRVGGERVLREGHEALDRLQVLALGLVVHHVGDLALAQVLP